MCYVLTLCTTEGCSQLSCKQQEKKGVSSYWVYNEIPVGFDSPEQSVKALTQTQSKSLSPALSSTFSDVVGGSNPLFDLYAAVTRKKDPASSCAKCLILNNLSSKTWSAKKSKDLLKVYIGQAYIKAAGLDVNEIIVYYKTITSVIPKLPWEPIKEVRDFYHQDWNHFVTTSTQDKRLLKCLPSCPSASNGNNNKKRHFSYFASNTLMWRLVDKPLSIFALRILVTVLLHLWYKYNYIQKAHNNLFMVNGGDCCFPNSDALVSSAFCQLSSLKCILHVCSQCKAFPKINNFQIPLLKCNKLYVKKN